jgi:hypothetical protein
MSKQRNNTLLFNTVKRDNNQHDTVVITDSEICKMAILNRRFARG